MSHPPLSFDSLPWWIAVPAALLLVFSGIITLIGSIGLLRLSSFYDRLHAPTLGNTLGVFCVLLASILVSSFLAHRPVVHELIIIVFLIITSPVTAMLLTAAALRRHVNGGATPTNRTQER
jgi:multicomponent K+:H+ antiporter subunit G